MNSPTDAATPEEYIARIEEPRRSEVRRLHDLIRRSVPELKPAVMGGMIGYGAYHYKYRTGREGDASVIALANQKSYISVYVRAVVDEQYVAEKHKADLPKASIGRSCIRIKRTSDIDLDVLAGVLREGADAMKDSPFVS